MHSSAPSEVAADAPLAIGTGSTYPTIAVLRKRLVMSHLDAPSSGDRPFEGILVLIWHSRVEIFCRRLVAPYLPCPSSQRRYSNGNSATAWPSLRGSDA